MSDEQLIKDVAAGSTTAIEELYDRYIHVCFGLALKIVRDDFPAEKVVHDTFLDIWSRPHASLSLHGDFSCRLLSMVHSKAIDALRRSKADAMASDPPLAEPIKADFFMPVAVVGGPGLPKQAHIATESRVVQDAVRELSGSQQQSLALAYLEGLTQREIAERLGEPVGTVRTQTRIALQQIHYSLSAHGLHGKLPEGR